MKKINKWLKKSVFTEPISQGCLQCAKGSKLVLFATGKCDANCFYCPLSLEKGGTDRIFADEWELKNKDDIKIIHKEINYIEAEGAGITGGDPLFVWNRVRKYIRVLKQKYGSEFHIHLYTSGLINREYVSQLVKEGLDEIRFHPQPYYWDKIEKSPILSTIKYCVNKKIDVAFEIPSIPGYKNQILSLIHWADENNLDWVNLNELEFSERNADRFMQMGLKVKDDISSAVKGSEELSYDVIGKLAQLDLDIGVHYCSSSFKDGIQLKNRVKRRAKNVVKTYEVITDEGTLLKGIVVSDKLDIETVYKQLNKKYQFKKENIFLCKRKNRIEIAPWILEKKASEINTDNIHCYITEEYPTADALEVERIPLPIIE